ncbi:MAG: UvrD-helicase domain-containing protein [Pirellulaceae bacterium]
MNQQTKSNGGEGTQDFDLSSGDLRQAEVGGREDDLHPLMIRASAGTGKTYQLTGRLLQILLRERRTRYDFGDDVYSESRRGNLESTFIVVGAGATDPSGLEKLRVQVKMPNLVEDRTAKLLRDILKDIHRLRICTLDSLFSQLARSFSYDLRLPAGWQLTDEIEESRMIDQAIGRMLEQLDQTKVESLFHMLSKGQAERNVASRLQQVVQDNYSGYRRSTRQAWNSLQLPNAPSSEQLQQAIDELEKGGRGDKRLDKATEKIAHQAITGQWDDLVDATLIRASAHRNVRESRCCIIGSRFPMTWSMRCWSSTSRQGTRI